jgi:hypothetical protein
MGEISDRLLNTVTGWFEAILQAVPRLVVAIVLLVFAVFIARVARKMLNVTLQKLKVDELMTKSGLDAALRRVGVQKLSDALPLVVYVLLLFIFAGAASDALGLTGVSAAIGAVLGYLPNVAAAVLLVSLVPGVRRSLARPPPPPPRAPASSLAPRWAGW